MDITKDVIEYLRGEAATPTIIDYNGMKLSTQQLYEVKSVGTPYVPPFPEPIRTKTLEGLVTLLVGKECQDVQMFVVIESPTKVSVVSAPHANGKRAPLFSAEAVIPKITYEQYIDKEAMVIMLRSRFVQTVDSAALLALIGNIKESAVRENSDDGVAQTITAKTGIATVGNATISPIQRLQPYRTFLDVEQPASDFLFRMQSGKGDNGPGMALFEADGGMWQMCAMDSIAAYLASGLGQMENITIVK